MTETVLAPAALDPSQLDAWRNLAVEAAESNPFFEPEFMLPTVSALGADEVRLLITTKADGSWTGLLPVHRTRRWRRIPLRSLSSWVNLYCFLGTPLLRAGETVAAAEGLLRAAESVGGALLGLDLLGGGGEVATALRGAAQSSGHEPILYETTERAALSRGQEGGYIALNKKHEREVARMRRRLQEELGGELEVVDRGGDPEAVEDFLRLEAAGWKGEEGTAFDSIGHGDLLREICRGFRDAGRLQMLALRTDTQVVAMTCSLLTEQTLFCFKIAFDERYARFSPGIQLQVDSVEVFDQTLSQQAMDSCALPHNSMINRLWTGRRPIEALAIPLRGVGGRLAPALARMGAATRRTK